MPRPKGLPKTGGRKVGTPNIDYKTLEHRCQDAGLDFFDELIKIGKDPLNKDYFAAVREGCQYVYPKKKALEVSGDLNIQLATMAKEFSEMPKEELIKIIEEELRKSK